MRCEEIRPEKSIISIIKRDQKNVYKVLEKTSVKSRVIASVNTMTAAWYEGINYYRWRNEPNETNQLV